MADIEESGSGTAAKPRRPWMVWLAAALASAVVFGGGTAAAVVAGVLPPGQAPMPQLAPSMPTVKLPVPSPTPSPTPTPPPPPRWPLSGVVGEIVDRPALVVKVENSSDARPQEGLDAADIVWEEMVEGGIARYVAMFHSTLPARIVPVRSIRPMDGPIASWTHGVFIYAGGQAPFKERAAANGLQLIASGSGLGRISGRVAPHNLAGYPELLLARADANHQAPPPAFSTFVDDGTSTAQRLGVGTSRITVNISSIARPRWQWDPANGKWLRFENANPARVVSGAQLSAVNVMALGVDIVMRPEVDSIGTHVPESIVVGTGPGLLASDGKSVPITWRHDTETAVWQFFDAEGQPISLIPGNTWVELVPNGSGSWSVS